MFSDKRLTERSSPDGGDSHDLGCEENLNRPDVETGESCYTSALPAESARGQTGRQFTAFITDSPVIMG